MPKLKQPLPLQKLVFEFLLDHVVEYCDDLSYDGYLGRFRQAVADIKKYMRGYVPSLIYGEFCRKFLDKFYSIGEKRGHKRPRTHYRAALEIMMDEKIVGLTCGGEILRYLSSENAARIHGLKIFDWSEMLNYEYMHPCLYNFRLDNLTAIIYPQMCQDDDLTNIASCCSELQVLRIQESHRVTDQGLRALFSCPKLRILNISCCSVSDSGINELLSVLLKLEEFNLGRCSTTYEDECFNVLSRDNSLVCPSVKRFAFKCGVVTADEHLLSAITLFPNLTRLEFYRSLTCDLCILKDFKNLTELYFNQLSGCTFENVKELLTVIGDNLSVLIMDYPGLSQKDLKSVFKICKNIDVLEFDYQPRHKTDILVIPPFEKLKALKCFVRISGDEYMKEFCLGLEFGIMLALERLTFYGFFETQHIIESIMLDEVKFPNLIEVRAYYYRNEHIVQLERLADEYNIDLSLKTIQK